MEEEGGVVFPVIRNDSNEIMHGRGTPSRVHHAVENIAQSEGRSHGSENVHDMLQRRPFAIPYDSDGYDFRSVHQGPTYLYFRAARALWIKKKKFVLIFSYNFGESKISERSHLIFQIIRIYLRMNRLLISKFYFFFSSILLNFWLIIGQSSNKTNIID